MEFTEFVSFLLLTMAGFGISTAAKTHQLDWTINNDLTKWATSRNIQDFNYNAQDHNVLQVSSQDYQSCYTENPIATYNSGIDLVRITEPGDYYYICGHEEHCQAGQQLHVSISKKPSNPLNPTDPTNPSNPTSNPTPPMANGEGGQCPPFYPYCNPVGETYPFYESPGEFYPNCSSSLAPKWLKTFGVWVGIFLASCFCGFTL